MEIVIINGSYHRNGMTSQLIRGFLKGFRRHRHADVTEYFLAEQNIQYCQGCYTCAGFAGVLGVCAISDDAGDIIRHALEADCVVFATPIYMYGPTALMKTLMERMIALFAYTKGFPKPRNPPRKGKCGVILLSSGAPWPINTMLRMMTYPLRILKSLTKATGASRVLRLSAGGMESSERLHKRETRRAYSLGERAAKRCSPKER